MSGKINLISGIESPESAKIVEFEQGMITDEVFVPELNGNYLIAYISPDTMVEIDTDTFSVTEMSIVSAEDYTVKNLN